MVDQLVGWLSAIQIYVHANEKEGHICLTWRGELRVTLMAPYLSCDVKTSGSDGIRSANTLLDIMLERVMRNQCTLNPRRSLLPSQCYRYSASEDPMHVLSA